MRLPFLFLKAKGGEAQGSRDGRSKRLAGAVESSPQDVQAARVRARRRLIGAGVLLVVGIVVFPMLFETTPRPLPIDTPIDASRVDGQATRVATGTVQAQRPPEVPPPDAGNEMPAAANPAAGSTSSGGTQAGAEAAAGGSAALVPTPTPIPTPAPSVSAAAAPAAPPAAAAKTPAVATTKAPVAATATAPAAATGGPFVEAVARGNTLEASAAQASAPRFVVQVGAFNEVQRMRDARAKVEKLGYKTYITEVDSATGKRTRVRLGPFASREEAEAAAAKVKTVGLPANIYQL